MPDLPSMLAAVAKNQGVLHSLYKDLASPGVRQVGLALETVLKTGNILLMPLRMLNEYAAGVERRNFEEIANRFKEIPENDIVDVRPEIGAPILDRLSSTQDTELRRLFIELLASAADKNKVSLAHPSFVRVIESISPDEAKMLQEWDGRDIIPSLMIGLKSDDGSRTIYDPYIEVPDTLASPSLASMYVANLEGLGLIVHHGDKHLTRSNAYAVLIDGIKRELPEIREEKLAIFQSEEEKLRAGDHFYQKGCLEITPYGRVFQRACIPPTPASNTIAVKA